MLTRRGLIAGAGASLALPARAQLPLTGAGKGYGGGGGAYHADAVHFDGLTNVKTLSLTSTDNGFFCSSFWAKSAWNNFFVVFLADPNTYNGPAMTGRPTGTMDYGVANQASIIASTTANPVPTGWANYIMAAQTDLPAGQKILKLYVNDIDVSNTFSDGGPSFNIATNGLEFWIGDDGQGSPFTGDLSDVRIFPGVNLLSGGDIPVANRRLFIDANGKPVDPSVATAALGTSGAILLSGDSTSFGTNQGDGGTFTTTGTLTNASTSPSD